MKSSIASLNAPARQLSHSPSACCVSFTRLRLDHIPLSSFLLCYPHHYRHFMSLVATDAMINHVPPLPTNRLVDLTLLAALLAGAHPLHSSTPMHTPSRPESRRLISVIFIPPPQVGISPSYSLLPHVATHHFSCYLCIIDLPVLLFIIGRAEKNTLFIQDPPMLQYAILHRL